MPESFRERVDVTSIIRSILDSYPLGNGILRELLQNSDDAGATQQTFILDLRIHASKSLVDPDLVHSQGPSLLAINNSLFTSRDWDAIRTIHNSSKTQDETKIGKFGIGVRACYHITDNPHFLSGRRLGIFDPHDRFSGGNAGGAQIDVVAEGNTYADQLAPFGQFLRDSTGGFSGTIVRLPLRTLEQALKSTIKQMAVYPSEVETLFHDFVEKELSVVMLFLKHIRSIELIVIDHRGVETFIGSANIPDSSIAEKRTFSRTGSDAQHETFKCAINVKVSPDEPPLSRLWRVYHTVGSTQDTLSILNNHLGYEIDAELLAKDKLFSHVAFAFPVNHESDVGGKLFTLLPLPILTGFPGHVHAILALTQDRQNLRNIQEVGANLKSRERLLVTWNRSIFNEFLPRTWSGLLRILVEMDEIKDVWAAWPTSEHVNDYWQDILPDLMDRVLASDLAVFPTFPEAKAHVSLSSALIALPDDDTAVLHSLSRLGLLIVQPPLHILKVLRSISEKSESEQIIFLHPGSVQEALLSRLSALTELTDEDKDHILKYLVLPPGSVLNAVGLPLVPLVNGSRISLSPRGSGSIYVLATKQEEEVFGDRDGDLISLSRMPSGLSQMFYSSTDVNVTRLGKTQVHFYLRTAFGNSLLAPNDFGDKVEWLTRFWRWMHQSTWPDKRALLALVNPLYMLPTSNGTLRMMQSRIVLPTVDQPTMAAWGNLGVDFLHPAIIPHHSVLDHVTVHANDVSFLVDAISLQSIPRLNEHSTQLIQNHVVQNASTLRERLKQDPAKGEAFIQKFLHLPIFPIRVVRHDGNRLSEIRLQKVSSTSIFVRIDDRCPVPLMPDHTFFDVTHSSGILGAIIDPIGYENPLDELGVLELAINHLEIQPAENLYPLLSRIVKRLPDLSASAKDKLNSVPFVPVKGSSHKVSPSQVIDSKSELAELYKGEAGKFPDGPWATDHLPILAAQGFFLRELNAEIVMERIAYLSKRWAENDFPGTFYKAKMFLMLLDRRWGSISQAVDITDRLTSTWLPIDKDSKKLAAPTESRDKDRSDSHHLFDLVLTVVDVKIHDRHLREALGWVGIPFEVLESQFRRSLTLSRHDRSRSTRLYSLIKEFTRRLPSDISAANIAALTALVSDVAWVPTSRSTETVVKTKYALLPPSRLGGIGRFHAVSAELLEGRGRDFLQQMGCSDSPCLETLLDELESISRDPLLTEQIKSQQALDFLREIGTMIRDCTPDLHSRILIPGQDGLLHPVTEVYFADTATEFAPSSTLQPVDSRMSRALALDLRVPLLSSLELESNNDDVDDLQMGEVFTKRVEGVLLEYDIHHALNEYLANAVDAKATEFSVALDQKTFDSNKVISPQLEELQGRPSLFLFNNAVFTAEDFRGLRMIGQGGKASDPDSIGRYGLGALSLFHFTDVVQLISAEYLLILDPSAAYLPPLKGQPRTSLLMRLSDISKRYPDHLSCFDSLHGFSKFNPYYHGTLFRLPLRTQSSAISPTALSITQCLDLLNGPYFGLARDSMFFTCLEDVSAQQRSPTGHVTPLWSVSASRKIANGTDRPEIVTLELADEQHSEKSSQLWLITKSTTSPSCAPPECEKVLVGMKLHMSKVGLVVRMAFLLEQTKSSEHPSHYFFSSLRLPVRTSLPAHIHAQFSLASDRRQIRFDPPDSSGSRIPQAAFNHWILARLVPPLYVSSIGCVSKMHSNKDPMPWWPNMAGTDQISRTIIHAFYELLPTSTVPICQSVISDCIAPAEAVFCRSETPVAVIKVLRILQTPNLVHLQSQDVYDLALEMPASTGSAMLRTVDPAFVRACLESRGANLPTFFTAKNVSATDINDVVLFLLEGGISITGLPLLIQADNTLVCAIAAGPVKYVVPTRLVPIAIFEVFPRDRFIQTFSEAQDLLLQTDVNVKPFDADGVLALLKERIHPMQFPCRHPSIDIEWISKFWKYYDGLPGPPQPASFHELPLIRTRKGEYISAKYCQREDVLSENPGTDFTMALEKMGVMFYSLPLPAPLHKSCAKEFTLQTCIRAIKAKVTSNSFPHLTNDEARPIRRWVQERLLFAEDPDRPIISGLPLWEALRGNERVSLPESQVEMLPFPSLHLGTFTGYIIPALALAEYSVPLETVIGWTRPSQVMSLTRLVSLLSLPDRLNDATAVERYSRLLREFFSLQDGGAWQLPVPDGDGLLRPANQLYDHTQPLFSEILTLERRSEEIFLHSSFRDFNIQLRSKGLKSDMNWESFLLCARAIHASSGRLADAERVRKAGIVYDFYNSRLQQDVQPQPEQWRQLRTIQFIPRHQLRSPSASSLSFNAASYCVPLPLVVSPSQLVRREHEEVAWTQRALFQEQPVPNTILFAVDSSLGAPDAKEVVEHLAVLALKVAPSYPGDRTLLKHLRATYKWLNENNEEAREFLLLRASEALFLNVDDPVAEPWEWRPAEQLFFNIDYDWETTFRVRRFLLDYRPLLLAAGGDSEDPVDYRPIEAEAQDSDTIRDAFNIMRKQGQLTDVVLIPTTGQVDVETLRAHSTFLAAAIPHVREARVGWREGSLEEHPFPGTYFGARAVLDFIYTGKIERNPGDNGELRMAFLRDLLELLTAADEWDMPKLKDEIGRLVNGFKLLSRDTYWTVFDQAEKYRAKSLANYCENWREKNPRSVGERAENDQDME
ncbi:hypothetical protein DFH07DRAFT_942043 [Mycena maculata]|uniref:BTB domain-containing protein n=1 Tax=Mycena maculata TaxID=230809 RepID=A0AAD7ISE2_9AGAR|nr:hypothetical protein DFH07DRAFT_942043 [Mycena maculata]